MAIDLVEAFKSHGIAVEDHRVPGYKNRTFTPGALLVHHTGSHRDNFYMNDRMYTQGREGLPGPVVQVGYDRQGKWHVFSDGYCNHAGNASYTAVREAIDGKVVARTALSRNLSDSPWYSANKRLLGIEVDLDGIGEPLGIRYFGLVQGCAAICLSAGWGPENITTHKFITKRKIDIAAPDFPAWSVFALDVEKSMQGFVDLKAKAPSPLSPVEIKPQFSPPIVLRPIVSYIGSATLLADNGDVYAFGAPYNGGPNNELRPDLQGKYQLFGDPAVITPLDAGGYRITTTTGHTYDYPPLK